MTRQFDNEPRRNQGSEYGGIHDYAVCAEPYGHFAAYVLLFTVVSGVGGSSEMQIIGTKRQPLCVITLKRASAKKRRFCFMSDSVLGTTQKIIYKYYKRYPIFYECSALCCFSLFYFNLLEIFKFRRRPKFIDQPF